MSRDYQNPATTIRRLVEGYQVSQAIHVAATLGIGDLLAGTSCTSKELALATGTHPPASTACCVRSPVWMSCMNLMINALSLHH